MQCPTQIDGTTDAMTRLCVKNVPATAQVDFNCLSPTAHLLPFHCVPKAAITGRKMRWPKGRAGSTPALGTSLAQSGDHDDS